MDEIFIENLRLDCRVGVTEEERGEPQKVIVDVVLAVDLSRAGVTESIDDTLDYREAVRQISQFVSAGEFRLIESLAEGVASMALERFDAARVSVKVRKEKYSSEPSIGVAIQRSAKGRG